MQKIMSQKEAYFYNFYGICIGTYLKCQIDVDHKRKNKNLLSTHNRKSLSLLSTVSSRKISFTYLCFLKNYYYSCSPGGAKRDFNKGREDQPE